MLRFVVVFAVVVVVTADSSEVGNKNDEGSAANKRKYMYLFS